MTTDDTPAVVTLTATAALAAICLAGSRWAGSTTVCRYIARRDHLITAAAALAAHLVLVVHDERRQP